MTDDQTVDECGICLEKLTAAVTLPCTHKFCADCLDGWKSKFGSLSENEKSCPLCRDKIPPSKDMLIQLKHHRKLKYDLEAKGETTSSAYKQVTLQIKELEKDIGDYDGEGLDYDECIDLPKYIYDAVKTNKIKRIWKWLGSPVDMKRLNARCQDHLHATLVHAAICNTRTDLLSILLQHGADVNALDAKGCAPLLLAAKFSFEQAKLLLEWGAEVSLPRNLEHALLQQFEDNLELSDRDAFVGLIIMDFENIKLADLISSEFGGRRCEVINLPNHPQLNGKTCVVEKYITKKDKYKIIFEGSGNAALVGPNNLKRRDRTPLDCGYYISFKNGRMSRREFATKEECQAYVTDSSSEDVKGTAEELESLKL